ncbi:MAG: hypothetical protein ACK5O2_11015 [Microthrixaceae bacterium]
MTNDSIDMLGQSIDGPVVDWHPPVLTWVLGVSWDLTRSAVLLLLIQIAAVSWAIRRVLDLAIDLRAPVVAVYGFGVVVCALPSVGVLTVSVWKDVLYAVGFLLVVEWVVRLAMWKLGPLAGPSDAASTSRLYCGLTVMLLLRVNGVVVVGLITVLLVPLVKGLHRQALTALLGAGLTFAVITMLLYPAFGVRGAGESTTASLAVFDLSAVAQHAPGSLDDDVEAALESMIPMSEYRARFNCHWTGNRDFLADTTPGGNTDVAALSRGWRESLLRQPFLLAGNHLCAASEVWSPLPSPEEKESFETVYDRIIPNDYGLRTAPISDRVSNRVRELLASVTQNDFAQVFLWRAATWFWLLVVLLAAAALRWRSWWCLVPLIPAVCLGVSVVAIFGPHYRYGAPMWMVSVLLLPLGLQLLLGTRSSRA